MNNNPDKLFTFLVNPDIPENLSKLRELSENLWSTWDKNAVRLFNRIDPIAYRKCDHNPVMLLHLTSEKRFNELSEDKGFLSELDSVYQSFLNYMSWKGYYYDKGQKKEYNDKDVVAYLSMEYGLHESIPIYSGGLGVLSGDYIKAASDQAIPLVGFGLLYKYGYFTQYININGEQQEEWKENQWHLMPVKVLTDDKNESIILRISINTEDVYIKVWTISVGKIKLYLLDTDIDNNSQSVRRITDKLYDSDRTTRLLQEIILSFGAMELMQKLSIAPKVFHLNEGHSALIIIDRLNRLINNDKYTFKEAAQIVANSTVFTTHTPVAAGNENFEVNLVKKYLGDKVLSLGLSFEQFFELAKVPGDNENFWLPALALRFSRFVNGVSRMHSETSRKLWRDIYPNLTTEEIPIDYITNGVHTGTWLSREMALLFDRYIGAEYLHIAEEPGIWQNISQIPDIEIWEAHQRRKEQMISFIRQRIEQNIFDESSAQGSAIAAGIINTPQNGLQVKNQRRAAPLSKKLKNTLSPDILTIGFARRFAPYKRANLLLQDPQRLLSIINNPSKPVQFVFAGKAHPADELGKSLIKNIIDFARLNDIEDRFVFIEDYDINVAKHIVQGVDVWLNTPIRPQEASGTSGMKAGLNGVINLSVMDGWWIECYDGENGWTINSIENPDNQDIADRIEANSIYDLLETEIAELYYHRNESNLPQAWLRKMKHSIYTVGKEFNLHRMLRQYTDKFYLPARDAHLKLTGENGKLLHKLLNVEKKVIKHWEKIYIKDYYLSLMPKKKDNRDDDTGIPVTSATTVNKGDTIKVNCYVYIDDLSTDNIVVELFTKEFHSGNISVVKLDFIEKYEDNVACFKGEYLVRISGVHGVNARIRANVDKCLINSDHLIKWKSM